MPGYVPFRGMLDLLRMLRCTDAALVNTALQSDAVSEIAMSQIARLLEPLLTSGALRGVGLDDQGRLNWVPVEAWSRTVRDIGDPRRGRMVGACLAALHTGTVEVPQGRLGGLFKHHAYLPLAAFNELFGFDPMALDHPVREPEHMRGYGPDKPVVEPAAEPPSPALARGGRPVQHDWDHFWREAVRWAALNDLDPGHRTELQRHLKDWCAAHMDPVPSDKVIREKIAPLFANAAAPNRT